MSEKESAGSDRDEPTMPAGRQGRLGQSDG